MASLRVVLATLLVFNAIFVLWVSRRTVAPVWQYENSSFYVVDSEWAGQMNLSPQKLPLSIEEVQEQVVNHVSKNSGPLMDKIEAQLREKHQDEMTASIRKQINAELREQVSAAAFYKSEKSYKVLDDLRAEYLRYNGDRLRDLILYDFLSNTTDANLKSRVSRLDTIAVDRQKYFHYVIRDILGRHAPYGLGVADEGDGFYGLSVDSPPNAVLSESELTNNRVRLEITDFLDLQDKHSELVHQLRELPRPPKEIYHGDGLVIAARKKDLVGAVNVLVQTREEGSELPAEIVLNTKEDYHEHVCEVELPKLNGRCVVAETEVGSEVYEYLNFKDGGFPLKVLALLVSSFDNTVFLDADTFPIKNVDSLLSSEPYLNTHCVLWPDLWHRTASPKFYEIAGISPGEPVRRSGLGNQGSFTDYISAKSKVAWHDLDNMPSSKSVESGQMVVSKSEHFRALFLALYYNLNGPRYYYPLLYQGSFGSGDRETFVPALEVMRESYYVTEWNAAVGGVIRRKVHVDEKYFEENALVQSDPAEAARYLVSWRRWLREKGMDSRLDPNENGAYTKDLRYSFYTDNNKVRQPTAFFLHVNDPKINTLSNEMSVKSRYDYSSRYLKNIGDYEYAWGKRDWELRFQAINSWTTCVAFADPEFWRSFGLDQADVCRKQREYVKKLRESTNDEKAAEVGVVEVKKES